MSEENRDYSADFSEAAENVTIDMPSEAQNDGNETNDMDGSGKTLTEEICAPEEGQRENEEKFLQNSSIDQLLKELNVVKTQNMMILCEIKKMKEKEKSVYEPYQQNLKDFQDTFKTFQSQLPQLITQLRTELKTGPGTDYKKIIQEAADNYKNLKTAIGNDINKAIATWNKVRGGEKERQKIERLLLVIAIMQAAITIRLLWNYFMGV